MCHECMPSAGWYQAIQKKCRCGWMLHEACNEVEFCFYCDWVEPDAVREIRLQKRKES